MLKSSIRILHHESTHQPYRHKRTRIGQVQLTNTGYLCPRIAKKWNWRKDDIMTVINHQDEPVDSYTNK